MLKVLQLLGRMDCGGAETMLMNIYRHIDKEQVSFDFLVCDEGKGYYDDEIRTLGGEIFYIGSQGKLGLPRYIRELKSFLHKNKYDIVHSHLDWQGGAIAYADYKAGVKRRIVHAHTCSSNRKSLLFQGVLNLEKYWINRYATDFWACSNKAASYLFNKRNNIQIIPNAFDLEKYLNPDKDIVDSIKKQVNAKEDTIIIGHIGNFSTIKNQKYLVELSRILSVKKVDHRLLFVGDDCTEYGQETKELVQKYSLQDYIYFLGLKDDIYNLVNVFDVFCFPSLHEGLGIVAVEAQAAGVPCIVSDGVAGEVDMGLSLVANVDLENPEKWADKILDCKSKKLNDKRRIGRALESKKFKIETNIKFIEKLYLQK